MADNPEDRREEQPPTANDTESEEFIELDDIAIGTTDEDEEIIELTEEVVDEAIGAVSSTTRANKDEEELDLSATEDLFAAAAMDDDSGWTSKKGEGTEAGFDAEAAAAEAEIDQELENYFEIQETDEFDDLAKKLELEEETPDPPVSPQALDAALERVINKLYAEKIEKMIADRIEKGISEKLSRLDNG